MNGRVVGHYRILEKIGAGGMGEVFRAHDERLGRDVALKFVRSSSSENPDHLRRFEQEARAAAALNHPNIVAVYDVGVDNGAPYIVSELLEGETLRQRLAQGPLPLRQAVDYGLQIVQGLIAAHERRIVHRDLKPENLFITRDGRVKILDFGVAKLQPMESERPIENLTTVTKSGGVVGTVAYMSPEQLRAKPVDHRSDIFSLGTILYEMLARRRAFRGETEVDTMSAVLREEPPELNLEQARIPEAVRSVVRHCLEKEPEKRFQSARDLAFALETLSGTSARAASPTFAPKTRITKALPWALAGALAATSVLLLVLMQLRPETQAPTYRRLTFEHGTVYSGRFAPDGQSVVYSAAWSGKPLQLFSTVGNSLLAQPLNFTDANLLAISRSNELALLMHGIHQGHLEIENGVLARAPLAGGSPREILTDVHFADWDGNGELAVVHEEEGHSRLEYPIGHVLYQNRGWISHIRFSPQGDKIAFMDHPALWDDRGSVCLVDFAGHVTVLTKEWESENGLAWGPDGKEILFAAIDRGGYRDLMSVTLSGRLRTLLNLPFAITLQDVAPDGRLLINLNTERLAMAAVVTGKPTVADLSWHEWNIAKDISRDDRRLLFEDASEAAGSHYSVAIRDLEGTPPIHLGEGSAGGLSPDGKWAISIVQGNPDRLELLPVGPGEPRPITVNGLEHLQNGPARFLSDGRHISINGNEPGQVVRCYIVDLNGSKPRAVTPAGIECMAVSPDGRYVLPAAGGARGTIYTTDGGSRTIPRLGPDFVSVQWSEDSSSVYAYRAGEIPAKVYRINITTGKKTIVQELSLKEPAGVVAVAPVVVARDAKTFAYSYSEVLSVLYVVSGVR